VQTNKYEEHKCKGLSIKAKLGIIYKRTAAPNDPHKQTAEDLYT